MEPSIARRLWTALEPYHAMAYFAPEVVSAMKDIGLKGYWMGYFAGRAAPMGAVPAEVVSATFFNFHPSLVHRAIPDAWGFAAPADVTAARTAGVDAALRRLLGDGAGAPEVVEAVALARRAAAAAGVEGRALYAGYASLDWPDESAPHLVLWHALTLLREHRGDGHVVALGHAGLDGCEAHVSLVASGAIAREVIQPNRGWSDEEWDAAAGRLRERGWLNEAADRGDASGDGRGERLSDAGRAERRAIEDHTDRLALGPCEALGEDDCARLISLVTPLAGRIVKAGAVPIPNPMGAPRP
ncbi:MAG: hypothetical protein QOI20_1757 [Acidimicrobiaceae bacterium]|nr:hypothetical protein [Acidimicrobiaceae bacterium]